MAASLAPMSGAYWCQTQVTDAQAKLIFYSAFVDGKLDAPKSLLLESIDITSSRNIRSFRRGRWGAYRTRSPSQELSLFVCQSVALLSAQTTSFPRQSGNLPFLKNSTLFARSFERILCLHVQKIQVTYCARMEEQKCKEEASCEHNGYRGLMFGSSDGVSLAPTVNADTAEWLSALSMNFQMKRELANGLQPSVWRSIAEMQATT